MTSVLVSQQPSKAAMTDDLHDKRKKHVSHCLTCPYSKMLALVQAVEAVHAGMGLEGIEHQAAASQSATRLQMWLRKSLNEQALGSRLLALCHEAAVLADWFEMYAAPFDRF